MEKIKFYWNVLKETFSEWNDSSASSDSTSLAYYAIFSLPGLLIIIIWLASYFFGAEAINGEIHSQISGIMGADVAKSIEDLIAGSMVDKQGVVMKSIGVGSLIFGATTLFFQLQRALDQLWDVKPAPKKAIIKFLLDRANSLGMIVVIGFLMMVSMLLSSAISLANNLITVHFGFETYQLMELVNFTTGFFVVMVMFAFMFKVLPDVKIGWKSVWAGAFLTALLFTLGKFLMSLYFSNFKPTSSYGAAGTIILMMMWINYSCKLIFFGAVFTKVYSKHKGFLIIPSDHAKWSETKLYNELSKKD
jgi:membrane protein